MEKLNFLFKSIRKTSISRLITVYKAVKKNTKKKFILFDILYCCFKYKAAFSDYLEFEFYSLDKNQRETYLTNGKNNEIVRIFNNKDYWHILDNKAKFNDYFNKYLKREYLNPNFSKEEFNRFIVNKNEIIIKPVDGIGGYGIKKVSCKNLKFEECNKFLLEEVIKQHDKLAELYDKSVNSVRIFTFFNGKEVFFLQAILKIGNNGITDNFSINGMYAFLNEKGVVITPAIDKNDNIFGIHPISKKQILGFKVPLFHEAVDLTLEAAKKIPQIKYIGWDIAITNDGPCIIEGNSYPGVFQIKPRFNKNKTGILPKYEQIMKIKL